MRKFLLAFLAVALFTGVVRADAVAGEVPSGPEPGTVSQVTETVTAVLMRAKGAVLGSLVQKGMTHREAFDILGMPTRTFIGAWNLLQRLLKVGSGCDHFNMGTRRRWP